MQNGGTEGAPRGDGPSLKIRNSSTKFSNQRVVQGRLLQCAPSVPRALLLEVLNLVPGVGQHVGLYVSQNCTE